MFSMRGYSLPLQPQSENRAGTTPNATMRRAAKVKFAMLGLIFNMPSAVTYGCMEVPVRMVLAGFQPPYYVTKTWKMETTRTGENTQDTQTHIFRIGNENAHTDRMHLWTDM